MIAVLIRLGVRMKTGFLQEHNRVGDSGFWRSAVLLFALRRITTPSLSRLALHPNFRALCRKRTESPRLL